MSQSPAAPFARVAVTGASGFVGRHLVDRLLHEGVGVVAVSRHPTERRGLDAVTIKDYSDMAELDRAFTGAEVVFHLAARAHRAGSADTAQQYHEANVATTANVAQACAVAGVRRLVFVSSIGVHGNRTDGRPFRATDAPNPVEAYADSKLEAERVLGERLAKGPTDYVVLRPPLVYGPGCPGNFRKLLNLAARAPIVPLGALDAPRTFIYIGNLVDAMLVAARHPAASRQTFVVADGRDLSVGEVVRTVAVELGRSSHAVWNVPPVLLAWAARLAGSTSAYVKLTAPLQVDASAFRAATGWAPPFDPRQGLLETARQWTSEP